MHVGVADHLGWAVVVSATVDGEVIDRRRIEFVESADGIARWARGGPGHADHCDLASPLAR